MMRYKKTHPLLILEGVKKLGLVFLIVFLRGLVSILKGGFYRWLSGAWVDVSLILLVLTFATLNWYLLVYRIDGEKVEVKGGLFLFFNTKTPAEKISSISCEKLWYHRPFSAMQIRFDTVAKTHTTLFLPESEADEIVKTFQGKSIETSHPNLPRITVLSALFSDSLAGAGLLAAFTGRIATLVGEEIKKGLTDTVANLIPAGPFSLAKTIATIILFGWATGFVLNLIKLHDLKVTRHEFTLSVKGGLVTKRTSTVKVAEIGFLEIKQGLFSKLFGIYSLFLHSIGKKKEDLTVLIPADDVSSLQKSLTTLLPEFLLTRPTLRPNKKAAFGFVFAPLTTICTVLLIAAIFPKLLAPSSFAAPILFWWLFVRILDFFTSGIAVQNDTFTFRYSSFFNLKTVVVKKDKITSIKLRQNPFQRFDERCDVLVYTKGKTAHHIRNVDIKEARKVMRI